MHPAFRVPYFEIGVKNYLHGDEVLELAKAADAAAIRCDIDVMLIAPFLELRRVAAHTERLIVLAPYMDSIRPGRGIADILPEALRDAGARGVVLNHCERPMSLSAVSQAIRRARELELLSLVCADTVAEARALAMLRPDIISPEPSALIDGRQPSDPGYVAESIREIKQIDPSIVVEQAAAVHTPRQVYDLIAAGAEAVGSCSGIMRSGDPVKTAVRMIESVRRAVDDANK